MVSNKLQVLNNLCFEQHELATTWLCVQKLLSVTWHFDLAASASIQMLPALDHWAKNMTMPANAAAPLHYHHHRGVSLSRIG